MNLPDFFWADRLTPVNFYGYASSVRERFYELDISDDKNNMDIERFNDLKRKCMSMYVDTSRDGEEGPVWSKDIWDNKIVIECKTERGATLYVGFYDLTYSLGLSMESRDGRTAKPYKELNIP